jgi:hypothetical protein
MMMADTRPGTNGKAASRGGTGSAPPPTSPFEDGLDGFKTDTPPERPSPYDDIEALRRDNFDDQQTSDVEQLTYISVRKPKPREFFRVNADPSWMLDTTVFVVKTGVEETYYIVMKSAQAALGDEGRPVVLRLCVSRQGALFIWPQPSPSGGKGWANSAQRAAELAKSKWVRIKGDVTRGHYVSFVAEGEIPEPVWPDLPFREMLKLGFGDDVVFSVKDEVVRREVGRRQER